MAKTIPFALITGCSSGIGKELAIAFAARGITVLATARRVESLNDLTSKYSNIEALSLELGNPNGDAESIAKLKEAVSKRTGGRLDFLVNNAGTHYASTTLDVEIKEVETLFQVNVFAVMQLCQTFMPLLRRSPRGRIVQIGSVTRDVPVVWQGAYNASKAALSQYSKTLRLELRPFGIEVVEIVTGFVRSNLLHHGFYAPETSLYLPVKKTIEDIKYQGNADGMPPAAYARAVVEQVTKPGTISSEIWEGGMARLIRFLVLVLPLTILNLIYYRKFKLNLLEGRGNGRR
ncbi:1-acyl dihydroxyacetone phosphate reductase [Aspergillus steynii IBT 23096]|uniref:1-acyl dihydroxyacetone phosphate reductase n=1 Tax=Aspergillus steynii IBT 23096 TaxID=1392250 RepID=A0A2I2G447_9EURO|nr:1-acyl dihydroxyacetone phosphate reductase [Aspergillus steynii IBT 23096]PLB47641.1 1-acyl dihydroxyacetone phosphate reductase [Aspergillus steynii IBT 23096]